MQLQLQANHVSRDPYFSFEFLGPAHCKYSYLLFLINTGDQKILLAPDQREGHVLKKHW